MRSSTSFGIRTIIIVAISVGLGLAFNSNRTHPLPLISTGENTQSAPQAHQPAPQAQPESPAQATPGQPEPAQAAPAQPEAPAQEPSGQPEQAQPAQTEAAAPAPEAPAEEAVNASANAPLPSPQGDEISLQDASVLFASNQTVFVDARDADTYAQGHIQGALSLPLFSFSQDFPAVRDRLADRTVITYCDGEHCQLSREVADQLKAAGLQSVFILKNGWTLWHDAGLPTATGSGQTAEGVAQ